MRQAEWYVDADTIGLGHVLASARLPVTWPGDDGTRSSEKDRIAPSPIAEKNVDDDVWIPEVTRVGMTIITRDKHIMSRTHEITAVVAARAQMFALAVPEKLNLWGLVRLAAAHWPEMATLAREPGPFIYNVSWTRLRRVWPTGSG